MMLRPRESAEQRVIDLELAIDPAPVSLHSIVDGYGNHIGIAAFSGRANRLTFESTVRVEHAPPAMSRLAPQDGAVAYTPEDQAALARYLATDGCPALETFAQRFAGAEGMSGAWPLLCALSDGIHRDFTYRRREAQGIQSPLETLQRGDGACRDFAVLMIAAARALGFPARFASGYLASIIDAVSDTPDYSGGNTHAWAQVYLPHLGWIDFDPTSGTIGRQGLVAVAVVASPEEAIPLQGTFLGFPADHIGMDVAVTITAH